MKPSEEFLRWWNEAIKSGSFQGRGEWMAWQARQPEIDALRRDNATFVGIHHELDLAKARIKELESVNVALIAERDMLRSELDGLKNQNPVAEINEIGEGLPYADLIDGAKVRYGDVLYAKPMPPAIPMLE